MVNYAYQGTEEGIAKAGGSRRAISTKYSVEICKAIKGKKVEFAKKMLQDAADLKRPIKITRFTDGAGHKPGVGPGKYPVKASKEILKILKSAEANAQNKGLGSELKIIHAAAHQAARAFKYGRHSRRQEKSTHIEIVLKEAATKREKKEDKK